MLLLFSLSEAPAHLKWWMLLRWWPDILPQIFLIHSVTLRHRQVREGAACSEPSLNCSATYRINKCRNTHQGAFGEPTTHLLSCLADYIRSFHKALVLSSQFMEVCIVKAMLSNIFRIRTGGMTYSIYSKNFSVQSVSGMYICTSVLKQQSY